jgi:hypothetical protein
VNQVMQYKIRSLTSADQLLLWEMLYLATFVPPGYPPPERSTLEHPDSAKQRRGKRLGLLPFGGCLITAYRISQTTTNGIKTKGLDDASTSLSLSIKPIVV